MDTQTTSLDEAAVLMHGRAVLDRYIKLATQDSRRNVIPSVRLVMINASSIRADGAMDALGSLCPAVHLQLAQEYQRAQVRFMELSEAALVIEG